MGMLSRTVDPSFSNGLEKATPSPPILPSRDVICAVFVSNVVSVLNSKRRFGHNMCEAHNFG